MASSSSSAAGVAAAAGGAAAAGAAAAVGAAAAAAAGAADAADAGAGADAVGETVGTAEATNNVSGSSQRQRAAELWSRGWMIKIVKKFGFHGAEHHNMSHAWGGAGYILRDLARTRKRTGYRSSHKGKYDCSL